jgi:hypothetical protein
MPFAIGRKKSKTELKITTYKDSSWGKTPVFNHSKVHNFILA